MKVTKFDATFSQTLTGGLTTGSSAGGDLSGPLPGPTVVGIGGIPVDPPDGIATDYLDGTGHWTAPAGGGGSGFVTNTLGGKEVYQTIAVLGATHTLDLANGNAFDATLTADCTLTFAGATAGTLCAFELWLRQDGTGGWTTTWPGSVVWPGGTAPTLDTALSTVTVLGFATLDGGTTWYGFPAHGSGGGGGGSGLIRSLVPGLYLGPLFGFTVTDSAHLDATHTGYVAFVDSPGGIATEVGWLSDAAGSPWWVKVQFPSAAIATGYAIMPWWFDNYPARTPQTWTFDGSNDDSTWTPLDTQTGYTTWAGATVLTGFSITNTAAYLYYRINITANVGADAYTGLGAFRIYG